MDKSSNGAGVTDLARQVLVNASNGRRPSMLVLKEASE